MAWGVWRLWLGRTCPTVLLVAGTVVEQQKLIAEGWFRRQRFRYWCLGGLVGFFEARIVFTFSSISRCISSSEGCLIISFEMDFILNHLEAKFNHCSGLDQKLLHEVSASIIQLELLYSTQNLVKKQPICILILYWTIQTRPNNPVVGSSNPEVEILCCRNIGTQSVASGYRILRSRNIGTITHPTEHGVETLEFSTLLSQNMFGKHNESKWMESLPSFRI